MRSRPCLRSATSPAASRIRRCCEMAWRVVPKGAARSLTERPPPASWSSSARRTGWARAANTSASASATALRAMVMPAVYLKAIACATDVKVIAFISSSAPARREPAMVLVIGATGTVGAEVTRQLIAAGQRPRALVRDPRSARERLGGAAELIVGDLDRPETLDRALDGAGRVFLLTVPGERQLQRERAVIDAARRAGPQQVVRLSRAGADERSPLRIARLHWQAERQLQRSGLASTILRPPMFMQNLRFMVRDGAISSAMGDGRVAMVDVRDVAAVAVAALTRDGHAGRTYIVTGPRAVGLADAAGLLSRQLGGGIPHPRPTPRGGGAAFL